MRSVRIYKDNLREHILKSLFFPDQTILAVGGLAVALAFFLIYKFLLRQSQVGSFLMILFGIEAFYAVFITAPIDNQPVYTLIIKIARAAFSKKTFTREELAEDLANFKVVGNYLERNKNLISIFEIEPFDVALLNDEEREQFYAKLKMALHSISSRVQIIARKEIAQVSDYHKHFFSLYSQALTTREDLIKGYITDLSTIIKSNRLFMVRYYLIFSTPLPTKKAQDFAEASSRLFDMSARFTSAIGGAHISPHQLTHETLVDFIKSYWP
jgi:hypothetical protein